MSNVLSLVSDAEGSTDQVHESPSQVLHPPNCLAAFEVTDPDGLRRLCVYAMGGERPGMHFALADDKRVIRFGFDTRALPAFLEPLGKMASMLMQRMASTSGPRLIIPKGGQV